MVKRDVNDVRVYRATFKNAKNVLEEVCRCRVVDRKVLYNTLGISRVMLINTIPPLFDMGLIDHAGKWHSSISITPDGRKVLELLNGGNKVALRDFMLDQIRLSPSMVEAHRFLKGNPYADYVAVGQHVTDFFNKEYKHKVFVKNIGRSYVNLLYGFGVSDSKPFTRVIAHEGKFLPRIFGEMIISEVGRFVDGKIKMPFEVSDSNSKKSRKRTEYKSMEDLGIVEQVDTELFKLTPVGKCLMEVANTSRQVELMREILIANEQVSDIMRLIEEQGGDMTEETVGDVIKLYNGANWKRETANMYGRRFLSWLRMAGMLNPGKGALHKAVADVGEAVENAIPRGVPDLSFAPALTPAVTPVSSVDGGGLNRLALLLLKFLAQPDGMYDDPVLKQEIRDSVDELRDFSSNEVVFRQMEVLLEMGFKHNDIECISGVARDVVEMSGKKLQEGVYAIT
ncbi:MAG: hypothetical protein K0A90_09730 [Methanosarcinaceae archaeon]|nr:hypothetical protein [Methanosarcinaceae archaeon]